MECETLKSFQEVTERDKKIIISAPIDKIQKALAITIVFFSFLNFLDIISTLYNLNYVIGAFEANAVLGHLISGGPLQVFAAIMIKIEIVAILLIIYFYNGGFNLVTRIVKLGTLAGLLAVIPIYVWGVILNNISIMIQ